MSLISSRVNAKQAITGVKVDSRKRKRGGRHNKDVVVDGIYDFVNLRYRDDIERYRLGKTVSE